IIEEYIVTLPSFFAPSISICSRSAPLRLAISATVAARAAVADRSRTAIAVRETSKRFGFIESPYCCDRSGRACTLDLGLRHRLDSATDAIGNGEMAVHHFDAGERIIIHPHELADLACIVAARQRGRERYRV